MLCLIECVLKLAVHINYPIILGWVSRCRNTVKISQFTQWRSVNFSVHGIEPCNIGINLDLSVLGKTNQLNVMWLCWLLVSKTILAFPFFACEFYFVINAFSVAQKIFFLKSYKHIVFRLIFSMMRVEQLVKYLQSIIFVNNPNIFSF